MPPHRRYSKSQKISAVTAAVASSTLAAAEQSGIPESTLRYWMNDPELAEIREKARAELAPMAATAAFLAWAETIRLLRTGGLEPRDVLFAVGLATDKSQLLAGGVTNRTETRALSDGLNDHEKQQLRDALDRLLSEPAEADAGSVAIGVGAEVRE